MPRKAKITAVPIDVQPDQTLEQVDDPEPKTEAEQMTDVINEVNVNEVESPVTRAVQYRQLPRRKRSVCLKKNPFSQSPK